jgi:hypothetical protein
MEKFFMEIGEKATFFGYTKPCSGYVLCTVLFRHIWARGRCYATPYNLPQTSVTAKTLGAMLIVLMIHLLLINIDKMIKNK